MPDIYNIFWKTHHVGRLESGRLDMWYLEGFWSPAQTPEAQAFEEIVSTLDTKTVMLNKALGTTVILVDIENQASLNAVVISMTDGALFLRLFT